MNTRKTGLALVGLLVLAMSSVGTVASAQTPAPGAQLALTRYIVRTSTVSSASGLATDVRRTGGGVRNSFSRVFSGFTATMTAAQARTLRADRRVESVTADVRLHSTAIQTNPTWGLDRIDQRSAVGNHRYSYDKSGAGVTAFVIDTGTRLSHSQFGGRAVSGYDFSDRDTNASDCAGHGTHVSGTIGGSTYGAAKGVRLVALRVLDCTGGGWASDIIDALDWAIAHKPAGPSVVNMSLGGQAYSLIDDAVRRTISAGITVVVAAGNEGASACTGSPSRVSQAITVAATDSHDTKPSWSNFGSCVDLFAPGVDVRSASVTSNTASEVMSGTSMATPHVTGLVARYLQAHPTSTPAQVSTALIAAATINVVKTPAGSPNRLAYAAPPVLLRAPGLPSRVVVSRSFKTRTGTIRWVAPLSNGGRAITGYRVSRNGKDSRGVGAVTVVVSAKTRTYTFTRLRAGAWYNLSVRAVNAVGSGAAVTKKITQAR